MSHVNEFSSSRDRWPPGNDPQRRPLLHRVIVQRATEGALDVGPADRRDGERAAVVLAGDPFSVDLSAAATACAARDAADEVRPALLAGEVSFWQILLKKSLMISGSSDSVAVMRFAVEAGDDGAARSRSRAAVLFILS